MREQYQVGLKLPLAQNLTKMVKISINTLSCHSLKRYYSCWEKVSQIFKSLVQDNLTDNPSASGFRGKPG